jgi:hypothetical protein
MWVQELISKEKVLKPFVDLANKFTEIDTAEDENNEIKTSIDANFAIHLYRQFIDNTM